MKFRFKDKKISGILTVIPKNEVSFDDDASKFYSTPKQMKRLKDVMGFDKRRIVEAGVSFSDLAVFGIEKLFTDGVLKKDEIGAIILVTQSPDYFLPPTSNVIHGRLDISPDIYCMDINNGCAGYVVGLVQAFQLLEHMPDKKIVFICGELWGEKQLANRDSLLWGDAVSISIVENNFSENTEPIFVEVKNYSTKWSTILIPAKNFKLIFAEDDYVKTSYLKEKVMQGGDMFKFTQVSVPPTIEEVLKDSGKDKSEIDWFLFHQPNKFMVENVAEILNIPLEKTPSNVVSKFGNAASATIPTNICLNLTPDILQKTFSVCMAGFGTGLTVGALTMQFGPLNFCEFVEY